MNGPRNATCTGLALCPRCKAAFLHPLLSADGTAWEADKCAACNGSWWHDPPKSPGDMNDAQRLASRWQFVPPKGWVLGAKS